MKRMKSLALLFLACATLNCMPTAQAAGLPLVQNFTVDARESIAKQAPILVLFMSNTCPYCETVLQDFLLPMQRDHAYDNKVILRQLEIGSTAQLIGFNGETTTPSAFAVAHKVWAVPTVMLFDSKGHVLTKIVGLLTLDFYLAYLDDAIDGSQQKIKAAAH